MVESTCGFREDMKYKIMWVWMIWREASEVSCSKSISIRFKDRWQWCDTFNNVWIRILSSTQKSRRNDECNDNGNVNLIKQDDLEMIK